MNFQLKDARSGGSMEFRTGLFGDANSGNPATCGITGTSCNGIGGRGAAYTVAGNVGLPLGETGFANLSLEYGNAHPTNRATQRDDAAALRDAGNTHVRDTAQVWGSPKIEDDLKIFGNFGYLFANGRQWYAHSNYASKRVTGGFYFRNPNTRGSVFSGDGGRTLLVGDVLAATGMGSADCPLSSSPTTPPIWTHSIRSKLTPTASRSTSPSAARLETCREGLRRSSAVTCTTRHWSAVSADSRPAVSPGTRA